MDKEDRMGTIGGIILTLLGIVGYVLYLIDSGYWIIFVWIAVGAMILTAIFNQKKSN
jgi:hypothetical protein